MADTKESIIKLSFSQFIQSQSLVLAQQREIRKIIRNQTDASSFIFQGKWKWKKNGCFNKWPILLFNFSARSPANESLKLATMVCRLDTKCVLQSKFVTLLTHYTTNLHCNLSPWISVLSLQGYTKLLFHTSQNIFLSYFTNSSLHFAYSRIWILNSIKRWVYLQDSRKDILVILK